MRSLKRKPRVTVSDPPPTIEPTNEDKKDNLELEEYKLAVQIQQSYHDVAYKFITVFVAITAISLGFVFRESVSIQLKIIFCWFNLIFSLFFTLCYLGFFIILKRIARRMDTLADKLSFNLRNHYALSYGVFMTFLSGVGVFIFWLVAIILRFWNLGMPNQEAHQTSSLLSFLGLA
jgi:hypothetical protein